jgi:uncharacterized damage-inducible protein DinB
MITPAHAQAMASYNRWQNRSLYREAGRLDDAQRKEARGAFFGSIHATLSHLLFGDQIWLHRFGRPSMPRARSIPESLTAYPDWSELEAARVAFDEVIIGWAAGLDEEWLAAEMTWKPAALDVMLTKPRWLLVAHMFNHQTHHRGQVHCLLTQAGIKPGDTDLPFLRP